MPGAARLEEDRRQIQAELAAGGLGEQSQAPMRHLRLKSRVERLWGLVLVSIVPTPPGLLERRQTLAEVF